MTETDSAAVRRLVEDAASLGVPLTADVAARLLTLLDELARWNRSYNLTAISTRERMVTHHILDSLAIGPDLAGVRIADVGTGAGFPGLPLALAFPQRQFTLIDSVAKKMRFVTHAVDMLGLRNVTTVHARVESMRVEVPFDTVVTRAFAPLPKLLTAVQCICGAKTQVLAMKGRLPKDELAALPSSWRLIRTRELRVPGLDAARCVIVLAVAQARQN